MLNLFAEHLVSRKARKLANSFPRDFIFGGITRVISESWDADEARLLWRSRSNSNQNVVLATHAASLLYFALEKLSIEFVKPVVQEHKIVLSSAIASAIGIDLSIFDFLFLDVQRGLKFAVESNTPFAWKTIAHCVNSRGSSKIAEGTANWHLFWIASCRKMVDQVDARP